MNYSTTEYKNAPVSRKVDGGTVIMVVLTVATIAACFIKIANIL